MTREGWIPHPAAGLARSFTVSVGRSFADELPLWTRMAGEGAVLPFQRHAWLEAWCATMGRRDDLDLLAVTVRDEHGMPVIGLPLVRERQALTRVGFADGGLSDYNAPILAAGAPQDSAGARLVWRALSRALPACDQIAFERMPKRIGYMVNPFCLLKWVRPSPAAGGALEMGGSYQDWHQAHPRRYRMELGRCARLFDALPGAAFVRVAPADRDAALAALEDLQRERIATLGLPYALDAPEARGFYRALAADLDAGPAELTLLRSDEGIIAVMLGLRDGARFVMLRIGAAEAQSRLSPARLLIIKTMEALREEGVTIFDFGLGDYPYKRKLGAEPIPLYDVVAAHSAMGHALATRDRVAAGIRSQPRLHAAARALKHLILRRTPPRG